VANRCCPDNLCVPRSLTSSVDTLLLLPPPLLPLPRCPVQVIALDEGGRRVAQQPTLFFLPHCESVLTDALLAANLEAGTLHNVVILGNHLTRCLAQWEQSLQGRQPRPGEQQLTTLMRLCGGGVLQGVHVAECGFPVTSAFNDMGLHWFPTDWRQCLDAAAPPPVR
jgi:hypothetical protein